MRANPLYVKQRALLLSAMHERCVRAWQDMDNRMVTKHGANHHVDEATRLLDAIWPDVDALIHCIDELHACISGDEYRDVDDAAKKTALDVHTALHHPEMHDEYEF